MTAQTLSVERWLRLQCQLSERPPASRGVRPHGETTAVAALSENKRKKEGREEGKIERLIRERTAC